MCWGLLLGEIAGAGGGNGLWGTSRAREARSKTVWGPGGGGSRGGGVPGNRRVGGGWVVSGGGGGGVGWGRGLWVCGASFRDTAARSLGGAEGRKKSWGGSGGGKPLKKGGNVPVSPTDRRGGCVFSS